MNWTTTLIYTLSVHVCGAVSSMRWAHLGGGEAGSGSCWLLTRAADMWASLQVLRMNLWRTLGRQL